MPDKKRVAVLPGDDAVPEAINATLAILELLRLPLEWEVLPDGEKLSTLPREVSRRLVHEAIGRCDSLLFGATSGKTPGLVHLRWVRNTFANVRPIRWWPGYKSPLLRPGGIDFVIVRENLEDLYIGLEGDLADLVRSGLDLRPSSCPPRSFAGEEGRYAIKVLTRRYSERIAHFACRLALRRKEQGFPGKITCSCKYNLLRRSDEFFRTVCRGVVAEYPTLSYEEFLVDDFARRLVSDPQSLDVVLLPNLYGDILSDEAAGIIGGLGLAPSGCYGDDFAYFEPVHGTAPDIAGKHVINPTATMLSAAMMLDYLGFPEAAGRLERALAAVFAARASLTPDQGGTATTEQFSQAVARCL